MCEQIAPFLQLDKNLLALANNSVQDRYDLIDSPTPAPAAATDVKDWLKKGASDLLKKGGFVEAARKDVPQEVRYGWGTGPLVDSFSGAMALAGSTTRTPGRYTENKSDGVRLGKTNEMIHPTVQYRMNKKGDYKPESLKGFKRQQVGQQGFEWRQGSTTIPEYHIKPEDVFTRYIADQDIMGPNNASNFIRGIDRAVGDRFM